MTSKRDDFMINEILEESIREYHKDYDESPVEENVFDDSYMDENYESVQE